MLNLEDAFHKLERGKDHLATFLANTKIALNKQKIQFQFSSKRPPKPRKLQDARPWTAFTLHVASLPEISKADQIELGEAIQSFRSSLDYLAWAWVSHANSKLKIRLTSHQKRQIAFPMGRNKKHFGDLIKTTLRNLPSDQCSFVEAFQPYHITAIKHLMLLSNSDKHRHIVPSLVWPQAGEVNFRYNKRLEVINEHKQLKTNRQITVGAKILTVVLAGEVPSDEARVHVDIKTTLMPMFPKSILKPKPPNEVVVIEETMIAIARLCTHILTEAKKNF